MEPTVAVPNMSFAEALRLGARTVVERAVAMSRGILAVQLPTGYGKTRAAAATYASLRDLGVVNRLLYLVPTRAQRDQFVRDVEHDFAAIGVKGFKPFDIGFSPALALLEHRNNKSEGFVMTIQALLVGSNADTVSAMMHTGRWMVVVDEYHHYANEGEWGRVVKELPALFVLAMSATPERKDQDSAFGEPEIRVSYRQAYVEQAVKRLELHAYDYRVDAVTVNGQVITFTTGEIAREVGYGEDAVEKWLVNRKLRWSPKYISPLVSIPAERLLRQRIVTGMPLQMLVGCMGCSHARMVAEQIQTMLPGLLRVDWVGTGLNGRDEAVNKSIITKFCPPKRADRLRHPEDIELDVLVHVGMAGEGLDSVFVSEIVHLNPAGLNNQNDQENGRAARVMVGVPFDLQVAYINVDAGSPYADWSGTRVMDVFDRENGEAVPEEIGCDPSRDRDPEPLPEEPTVIIARCELQNIDKGDPEVVSCAGALVQAGQFDPEILKSTDHPIYDAALLLRRKELEQRAAGLDRMSVLAQLASQVDEACGKVALLCARLSFAAVGRFERSMIGDFKKRIRTKARSLMGRIDQCDEDGRRKHYRWIKELENEILNKREVPEWLR